MNTEKIKELLDSCFIAKRITETMMELPEGLKPRHIHVIESIFILSKEHEGVRVSDVSRKLNITTPSVTNLINELEEKNVIEKYSRGDDKRVTLLGLTKLGNEYQSKYVAAYHAAWAENLIDITDEEVDIAVKVILMLQQTMPQGGQLE